MADSSKHEWRPKHGSSSSDVEHGVSSLKVIFEGPSVLSVLVHVQESHAHLFVGVLYQDVQGPFPSALIVSTWAFDGLVDALLLMDEYFIVGFLNTASSFTIQTLDRFSVVKSCLENVFKYEVSVVDAWVPTDSATGQPRPASFMYIVVSISTHHHLAWSARPIKADVTLFFEVLVYLCSHVVFFNLSIWCRYISVYDRLWVRFGILSFVRRHFFPW